MTAEAIGKIREKAAAHHNGVDGFDNNSRRNAYVCDNRTWSEGAKPGCGYFIITVDREPGVTPAMLTCPKCGNLAGSKFYKIASYLEPTHEWYRPETLDGLTPGEIDHVENGGLLIRKIGGGDYKDGWQPQERANIAKAQSMMRVVEEVKRLSPPVINRADYPNRQQYRAALRRASKADMALRERVL